MGTYVAITALPDDTHDNDYEEHSCYDTAHYNTCDSTTGQRAVGMVPTWVITVTLDSIVYTSPIVTVILVGCTGTCNIVHMIP